MQWRTEKRRVKDLLPWDKNPRTLSKEQEEHLKESISKYNLAEIPVINLDNRVAAGHQRLKILHLLGRSNEMIDVRVPNRKLTQKEFEEYNLRSNANTGSWDFEKLLEYFDIDTLLEIGFDEQALADVWDSMLETSEDENWDLEKEIKKAQSTKIKPGDLFSLGRHTLLCADSLELKNIKRLVGNQKMDVLYVDLPYNTKLSYSEGVGKKRNYGGHTNDNKTDAEYEQFVTTMVSNGLAVSKPDVHSFFWCDERYIGLFQKVFANCGINSLRVCYWLKNGFNVTPQVAFNKVLEACVYGTVGKPYLNPNATNLHELLNKELGTGNQLADDILDQFNIWLAKRDAGQDYQHPTQKPITLAERPLRRCSKPGDNVLDLTAGSGSTILTCEQLKRRCFACEIEPVFCQVILNRFQNYAKQKVKKLN